MAQGLLPCRTSYLSRSERKQKDHLRLVCCAKMFPFIVVTTQDFTHRSKSKVRGTVHDSVIVSRSLTGGSDW